MCFEKLLLPIELIPWSSEHVVYLKAFRKWTSDSRLQGDGSPIIIEDRRGSAPIEIGRIDATAGDRDAQISAAIAAMRAANIN